METEIASKTEATVKKILLFAAAAVAALLIAFYAAVSLTKPETALKAGDRAEEAGFSAVAVKWYLRAGRAGIPAAQRRLGEYYEEGRGVRADGRKAIIWYELCARNPEASEEELCAGALGLGRVARAGDRGLEGPDEKNAYLWFLKAADLGSGEAMFALGEMTRDGIGCEKDLAAAEEWFAKAASAGFVPKS